MKEGSGGGLRGDLGNKTGTQTSGLVAELLRWQWRPQSIQWRFLEARLLIMAKQIRKRHVCQQSVRAAARKSPWPS